MVRRTLAATALLVLCTTVLAAPDTDGAAPEQAVREEDVHIAHENDDAHDHDDATALDTVVVESTRSRRRVVDEPIRVEVVEREEIEEKLLMTPGNIAMLVAETPGVRVQVTSPALGASTIRMQGLRGRYTQLLADGLPLYGGQASSIGLLQIPPTDLGRVEIIKGAASALYGPSALGGVVNLISRRPGDSPEHELLINTTSRDGQDLTAYAAGPLGGHWSGSVVAGTHQQARHDLDGDGWVDMPGYSRQTLRPRLYWEAAEGARAMLTLGAMDESRRGGTLRNRVVPDGAPYRLTQDTRRVDAGAIAEFPLRESDRLHVRASAMRTDHGHRFGPSIEEDRHGTGFAEASWASGSEATTWLAGLALQRDAFRSDAFPELDYAYTIPALFAQGERNLGEAVTLAGSARWDQHDAYGGHFSPRLSLLYAPGAWSLRTSIGRGFHAPTPFVEEIEAAGLSRLDPLEGLRAETATTASVDLGYAGGALEAHLSLFASDIAHAVRVAPAPPGADGTPRVRLENAAGETRTRGSELLLRWRRGDFVVTGSYVHTDSTEDGPDGEGRRRVPLTPRRTGGVVAMWEQHGRFRLGVEAYYTGSQSLDDNPFRAEGDPYFEVGILGEITRGRVSWFLNLENLLDVRQTDEHPLVRPQRAADGRWTVDAWAPADGFVVNGGMRLRF